MGNLIRCPQCEMPYLPGEAAFCGNCGAALPESEAAVSKNINNHLSRIENAPRPYSALRFISSVIIIGGWVYIFWGWAITILWFTTVSSQIQEAVLPLFVYSLPPITSLIFLFVNTLIGLVIIGVGQVYAVIIDIRDDMNTTMKYVRYGLKSSQGSPK
jgi:hypothetical protein